MSKRIFLLAAIAACLVMAGAVALAQTQRAYRGTYQSMRQLILRIENRSTVFRNDLQSWSDRHASDSYSTSEDINLFVRDFDDSVRRLHQDFDRRQSTRTEAQDVLDRAAR